VISVFATNNPAMMIGNDKKQLAVTVFSNAVLETTTVVRKKLVLIQ